MPPRWIRAGVRLCDELMLLCDSKTCVRRKPNFDWRGDEFLTSNPRMLRMAGIVRRVAYTDVPILILGESGVGKEVMALFAHRHSGREEKPFVKVNCAALPHELLESEFFGYERGAFTGAVNDKIGKFEQAHTGNTAGSNGFEMYS